MPSIGINLPVGSGSSNHSIGTRLGLMLGWNVRPTLSVNAELSLDRMDGNGYSFVSQPDEKYLGAALSPLFPIHLRGATLAFGPTVGYFRYTLWTHELLYGGTTVATKQTAQGFSFGLNLGLFIPVGDLAVGGMFNARVQQWSRTCTTHSSSTTGESCDDSHAATNLLGLSAAALF